MAWTENNLEINKNLRRKSAFHLLNNSYFYSFINWTSIGVICALIYFLSQFSYRSYEVSV